MLCAGYGVFALVLFVVCLYSLSGNAVLRLDMEQRQAIPCSTILFANHTYSQNANYQTLRETPVVSVVEEKFKYAPPGPDSEDWA